MQIDIENIEWKTFTDAWLRKVDEIIGDTSEPIVGGYQTEKIGQIDKLPTKLLNGLLAGEEGVKRKLKTKDEYDGNLAKRHRSNSLDDLAYNIILKDVSTQTDGASIFEQSALNVGVQTLSPDTDMGGRTSKIENVSLTKLTALLPQLNSHDLEALYSAAQLHSTFNGILFRSRKSLSRKLSSDAQATTVIYELQLFWNPQLDNVVAGLYLPLPGFKQKINFLQKPDRKAQIEVVGRFFFKFCLNIKRKNL
uniref:Uncharacterized protein n=1 Tax=Glossina palpalis gambiensis TaxID=67801 RepID=A0A1B0B9M7_9MUSC